MHATLTQVPDIGPTAQGKSLFFTVDRSCRETITVELMSGPQNDQAAAPNFLAEDQRAAAGVQVQTEFPLTVPVCAWCKPRPPALPSPFVSHGICLRHLRALRLQLEGHRGRARRRRTLSAVSEAQLL